MTANRILPGQLWASQQVAGADIRWKGLEIAAFSPHRRVLRALGTTREEKKRARQEQTVKWWHLPLALVLLAASLLYFYPAGAFLLLANGRNGRFDVTGIEPDIALPLAGSLLLIGGAVHGVAVARRRQRGPLDGAIDAVAVLFGGFDAITIGRRGSVADVPGWPWWVGVAVLVVVVGVAGLVRSASLAPAQRLRGEPRAAVRRQVARLSADERDAVRRDLRAAIEDLADRDLISPALADRARHAELGMLSIAVSS